LAPGTVDVEPIRMIFPAADRSAFFGEDIAAAPALITVPTETPPRKEPTEKAFHFKPSLPPLSRFYLRMNVCLKVFIEGGGAPSETSEHVSRILTLRLNRAAPKVFS